MTTAGRGAGGSSEAERFRDPLSRRREGRKEIVPFANSGAAFDLSTTKEQLAEAGEAGRLDRSAELQRNKVLEPSTQTPAAPHSPQSPNGRKAGPTPSSLRSEFTTYRGITPQLPKNPEQKSPLPQPTTTPLECQGTPFCVLIPGYSPKKVAPSPFQCLPDNNGKKFTKKPKKTQQSPKFPPRP